VYYNSKIIELFAATIIPMDNKAATRANEPTNKKGAEKPNRTCQQTARSIRREAV